MSSESLLSELHVNVNELKVKIKPKHSNIPGKVPTEDDLEFGEIAINLADGLIFTKNEEGEIIQLGKISEELLVTKKITDPTDIL